MKLSTQAHKLIMLLLIFSIFLSSSAFAWKPDYRPPPEQLKKLEKRNDERRVEKNTTALLFGKVIDFSGEPVAGATVTMRLSAVPKSVLYNDQRLVTTITDSAGRFSFEEIGFMYYLDSIKCSGYQFKMDYIKERSLEFKPKVKAVGKGYQPEKPMLFRVRKKESPSLTFLGNMGFLLRKGESKLLDLYMRKWADPDRLSGHKMTYPEWHADLSVRVEEDGDQFRLIIEALKPNSGFVKMSPEFIEEMTEAPENGYQSKLILPFKKNQGNELFAYVKSAGGLFYSKLYLGYSHSKDKDYVELRSGYYTNMAGGRGLEFSDNIYRQYLHEERKGLREQALRKQLQTGETVAPLIEKQ